MPNSWDAAIADALAQLARSRAVLERLEASAPPSSAWKDLAPHQSAVAKARRQVTLDAELLRAARLRAVNGRIEAIRRPPRAPDPEVQAGDLFLSQTPTRS